MRHQRKSRRFGMSPSHRRSMFRNMVTSLFVHERIRTTLERAKELRRVAEKLITLGKRGDLSARRLAARTLRIQTIKEGAKKIHKEVALVKLFETLAPRYSDRPGGYTRIIKIGRRRGDNAPLALLEMIPDESKETKGKATKKKKAGSKTSSKTATPKKGSTTGVKSVRKSKPASNKISSEEKAKKQLDDTGTKLEDGEQKEKDTSPENKEETPTDQNK